MAGARRGAFSSPEPTILPGIESSGQFRNMRSRSEGAFFVTVGNHYCFKVLSLRRRTGRPLFTDFLDWNQRELSIPTAGQKDRGRGLWGREWKGWKKGEFGCARARRASQEGGKRTPLPFLLVRVLTRLNPRSPSFLNACHAG